MDFSASGIDDNSMASPMLDIIEPLPEFLRPPIAAIAVPAIASPTRSQSRIPVNEPDGEVVGL